jgi:hypothetical protein
VFLAFLLFLHTKKLFIRRVSIHCLYCVNRHRIIPLRIFSICFVKYIFFQFSSRHTKNGDHVFFAWRGLLIILCDYFILILVFLLIYFLYLLSVLQMSARSECRIGETIEITESCIILLMSMYCRKP